LTILLVSADFPFQSGFEGADYDILAEFKFTFFRGGIHTTTLKEPVKNYTITTEHMLFYYSKNLLLRIRILSLIGLISQKKIHISGKH
jgi:hypothetical protein